MLVSFADLVEQVELLPHGTPTLAQRSKVAMTAAGLVAAEARWFVALAHSPDPLPPEVSPERLVAALEKAVGLVEATDVCEYEPICLGELHEALAAARERRLS